MNTNKPININARKFVSHILGMFFLISWTLGELPRFLWTWPVTLLDIAVIVITLRLCIKRSMRLPRSTAGFAIILGGSWLLSLRIFSIQEAFPGFLYLFRTLLYVVLLVHAKSILGPMRKYIVWGLGVFVMLGLLQYLFAPDMRFLLRYGWDEHYYRLIGTVLDPNYAGAMFGMIGLFVLDRFLEHRKRIDVLLGISSVVALALTFSRASWLSAGIALVFYFIAKGPTFRGRSDLYTMAIGIVALFSAAFFIAPKPGGEGVNLLRTNSIVQRIESWGQAMVIWKTHPFLGVGFNNYHIASEKYLILLTSKRNHAANAPDSSWLLLLSTTGVVGSFLIGNVAFFILQNRYYNQSGRTKYNTIYVSLALLVAVHALFNNTLFYPPILGIYALLTVASSE